MTIRLSQRRLVGAALTLALTSWGITAITTGAEAARPGAATGARCGVHLLPSLDPTGAHPEGEVLDLTEDGLYVGSAHDSHGEEHAAYWIDGVAHRVPVDLEEGDLLDVNRHHVAVGDGYDAERDLWRGYVVDLDTGEVTWLPGIGGTEAGARRINDHGVAVGGADLDGTGFPIKWRPPYDKAQRLASGPLGGWAPGNNNRGDIVGSVVLASDDPDFPEAEHAVVWGSHGRTRLGEAGPYSHAFDVNDAGLAVGLGGIEALLTTMPAYWSLRDRRLHVMGSPVPGTDAGIAYGVSEGGWAAGGTQTYTEDSVIFHAFLWTGSGKLRMLPGSATGWADTESIAHGVSDLRDEVTGRSSLDGTDRPTIWRCASKIGVKVH